MSDDTTKEKRSKRLHDDETKIKKQLKIAKQHGIGFYDSDIKQPHRLVKRHAMDCGNPDCHMCGNPRKLHKDKLTFQEKSFYQEKLYNDLELTSEN